MEITTPMLKSYERFMRTKRTIIRFNQLDKEVTTECKGVTDSGIYNYMRDLQTLFNAAREKYNDEDLGIIKIPHYPFAKYKVGSPPQTEKRNIPLKGVRNIRDCNLKPGGRAKLARDLFMLSFYLCGINAVDLYNCKEENIKNGRLEYRRSKTKGKRKDNSFISIKIVDEAKPLLRKYLGKLSVRYSNFKGLDSALSKGMREISTLIGIPNITFY